MNESLKAHGGIPSYGKVYNLGHKRTEGLLNGAVTVEEKVDGSQLNFAVQEGELYIRSRKSNIYPDAPPKMFADGVTVIQDLVPNLREGWVYRAEYLQKPKHNTLQYERIPAGHLALFEVEPRPGEYLFWTDLKNEAGRLGLDVVPILANEVHPPEDTLGWVDELLETESFLGGEKIEGVVIKNRRKLDAEGKLLKAKFVSEKFKERHQGDWKKRNPNRKDVLASVIEPLRTVAKWEKAVQHVREAGQLVHEPKDIGPIMKELAQDVDEEDQDWIKEQLWQHFRKDVIRGVQRGLPEWYKRRLAGGADGG